MILQYRNEWDEGGEREKKRPQESANVSQEASLRCNQVNKDENLVICPIAGKTRIASLMSFKVKPASIIFLLRKMPIRVRGKTPSLDKRNKNCSQKTIWLAIEKEKNFFSAREWNVYYILRAREREKEREREVNKFFNEAERGATLIVTSTNLIHCSNNEKWNSYSYA